ncbi:hypothetical protein AWN76_015230 [Rhodothermaceae bacterium RA]|nr:hypothetical protein AWN76_015230 [Rhodothermaceae bacterium RA]
MAIPSLLSPLRPGIVLLLLGLVGCSSFTKSTDEKAAPIQDVNGLVEYLHDRGIAMQYDGPYSGTEATATGQVFTVTSGGQLFIFEYASGGDAITDMDMFQSTTGGRNEAKLWRREKLVVVFSGDDPRVDRALTRVLGAPIH